jgi:hypothetical protein
MVPNIIDIEASGFGPAGYPIEVGVALASGGTYCSLILPAPDWSFWDTSAEEVHRIPRDILETYGKPIQEVAERLNAILAGETVYTDGWEVDKPWLTQLFHAAGIQPQFGCSMLDLLLTEAQMEMWHQTKRDIVHELKLTRHRASVDAVIVQKTYLRTRASYGAAPSGVSASV